MAFDIYEKLALDGGPKAKRTPFSLRKRHGELEKKYLSEVIDSDVLFYFAGTKVFEFQKKFAAMYGRHAASAVDRLFDNDGSMITGHRPN